MQQTSPLVMNMITVPSPEHHGLGSGGTGLVSEVAPLCRSVENIWHCMCTCFCRVSGLFLTLCQFHNSLEVEVSIHHCSASNLPLTPPVFIAFFPSLSPPQFMPPYHPSAEVMVKKIRSALVDKCQLGQKLDHMLAGICVFGGRSGCMPAPPHEKTDRRDLPLHGGSTPSDTT